MEKNQAFVYTKRRLEQEQNLPVGAYEAGLEIQASHVLGDLSSVYISFTSICSSCDPRARELTVVDERGITSIYMLKCLSDFLLKAVLSAQGPDVSNIVNSMRLRRIRSNDDPS